MGITVPPEIRMARRILKNHSLSIPFNLTELVSYYAKVIYKPIPISGIDGVCINLKTPGKSSVVVVNEISAKTRQKFTLAHELGHIIIPWHLGTIVDDIDLPETKFQLQSQYWTNEQEANRFASELLMPFEWLYSVFLKKRDYDYLVLEACSKCGVSEAAARIRVQRFRNEVIGYLFPIDTVEDLYAQSRSLEHVQRTIVERGGFHPIDAAWHIARSMNDKISFCVEEDNIVIDSGC